MKVKVKKMGAKNATFFRFIDEDMHNSFPDHYPPVGTEGKFLKNSQCSSNRVLIKWPHGTTSGNDEWFAYSKWIEVVK